MKIDFIDSIEKINKEDWEAVLSSKYPFLKYEFLKALEVTNCVSPEQGWTPLHLIASENERIMAIMPLYIKTDSQGEFIFDWSWADAYYRNGLNYYPKLVSSIPFTPASGPRILITNETRRREIIQEISKALKQITEESNFSSVHILLANKDEIKDKVPLIKNDDLLGGILMPGDGSGDPSGITQLLAKAARAEGAKIFEDSPVEDILVKNKRIEGVVVNGEKIECEYIVLATGMWSRQIGEDIGVSVPLYPNEHFYVITEPMKDLPKDLPVLRDYNACLYLKEDAGKMFCLLYTSPSPRD